MSGHWPPEWEDPDDGRPDDGLPDGQRPDDGHSELDLSGVTAVLASVHRPALPASFEARISAAIATEAAARATSARAGATKPAGAPMAGSGADDAEGTDRSANPEELSTAGAAGGPATSASRRPRRGSRASRSDAASSGPGDSRPGARRGRLRMPSMQAAGWALVCCLVLSGFGYLVTDGGAGSTSSSAERSAASQPEASSAGTSIRKQPDTEHAAGTLPEAASSDAASASAAAGFVVHSTGIAYQRSTLASRVRAELASAPAGGSAPSPPLSGCVSQVTGGAEPSLVDRATYDGIPAYIIAVPTEVWVVRRGCTAADTQLVVRMALKG